MKFFLSLCVLAGLAGCMPPPEGEGRDEKSSGNQEPAGVSRSTPIEGLSPLAKELHKAFREGNAYKRNDLLAVLMTNIKKEGKPLVDLFDEAAQLPAEPGWDARRIQLGSNDPKRLNVFVPESYNAAKPTPVIVCYHPSGGDGFGMVSLVQRHLGPVAKDFILVGPDDIGPYNIDSQRSYKGETRTILRDIRSRYNVDSNRVYAIGFSLGGYAVWSQAAYFGDEFASGVSVGASFDAAPEIPGMWETLLPNTKQTPVLYAWGDKDGLQIYGIDLKTQVGLIGTFNPQITALAKKHALPHEPLLMKGIGHSFEPPADKVKEFLTKERSAPPTEIHRAFRTINQGRAYWLEAIAADGPQWHYEGVPIDYEAPESKEKAIGRVLLPLLARMDAKRDGNSFTIDTKGIGDLAVWFTDEMIDWEKPVTIVWNGKQVFNEKVTKSDEVCLLQYVRTLDRQRLCWGGVRLSVREGVHAITIEEGIPNIIAPVPYKPPT